MKIRVKTPPVIDAPAVTIRAINERYQRVAAGDDYAEQQAIDGGHCRTGKRVEPLNELAVGRGTQLGAEGLSNEPSTVPIRSRARPLPDEPPKARGQLLSKIVAGLERRNTYGSDEASESRADC